MKWGCLSMAAMTWASLALTGCGAKADQSGSPASETAVETVSETLITESESAVEAVKENYPDQVKIELSDSGITVDGAAAGEDPEAAVYTAKDIVYYEDRDTYDSGNTYGEGEDADKHSKADAEAHTVVHITKPGTYRISGKLSAGQIAVDLGKDAKTDPEAVVTLILDQADITCSVAPGIIFYNVYECDTKWVEADSAEDEDEVKYEASATQDTAAAGANIILADGTTNTVNGSYVAKIYKDNDEEKKLHKYDGAFYSKMSMNVTGESAGDGVLNIIAANEGLDTEMHLTINGGIINIQSADDGINTNEDGVSVTTINGGQLHIVAGLGAEGDGIDSNGYLVINGGVVIANAKPQSDSGLDSDMGSYINGGYVLATGSTMDWAESDSDQVTMNLQFASQRSKNEAIVVTDTEGKVVFAYDPDQDETTGSNNRGYSGAVLSTPELKVGSDYYVYVDGEVAGTDVNGLYDISTITAYTGGKKLSYTGTDVQAGPGGFGMGGPGGEGFDPGAMEPGERPEMPEGMEPGEIPEMPEGMEPGERPEMPEGMEGGGRGRGNGEGGMTTVEASDVFHMTDKVNAFSGISEAAVETTI